MSEIINIVFDFTKGALPWVVFGIALAFTLTYLKSKEIKENK